MGMHRDAHVFRKSANVSGCLDEFSRLATQMKTIESIFEDRLVEKVPFANLLDQIADPEVAIGKSCKAGRRLAANTGPYPQVMISGV